MNILSWFRAARRGAGEGPRARRSHKINPLCESLEDRALLSAASLAQIIVSTNLELLSANSTVPTGLSPAEILKAYGIDGISFSGGTESGDGAGQTIAIVDAYNDPAISSDLAVFDAEYGLSAPPSFTVDNLGATTTDAGWALETALDVEWAHAVAPDAQIILVEASSDSLDALFSAVSYASRIAAVSVVSMSWGMNEFSVESTYDSLFTTPAGHQNVTYVAASGDSGAGSGPEYPSVSPNVLAVGGTTLTIGSEGSYVSESGWSGSTGGFSVYEAEASYQASTLESVGLSDGVRTTPDVSFDADPNSGVSVYDSIAYDGQSGWFQVGGTSAAAPAWAGLVAIVDQGLATGGVGTLSTRELLTDLYSLPSSDFNDITTGDNGYSATTGYDLVTGLGTPKAEELVAGLLAANGVSDRSSTTTSSGVTTATGSDGSTVGTTGTTGSTTPTPSPTSTSHHVSHVHSHKTKTHHTKVQRTKEQRTKVQKTKSARTKSRHDVILHFETDVSANVDASSTDSGSSGPGMTSEALTVSPGADSAMDSLRMASVSASTVLSADISMDDTNTWQAQPVSTITTPFGQIIAASASLGQDPQQQLTTSHGIDGAEARDRRTRSIDDLGFTQRAAEASVQGPGKDRSPVIEEIHPWPSMILDLSSIEDDFDVAIVHLGEPSSTGRLQPTTTGPDEIRADRPEPGVSTLVGTAAVAIGGYRLALQRGDPKRGRWWSQEASTRYRP